MTRTALLWIAALFTALANSARADLRFSETGENLGNGYQRLMYFVTNDGTNGTGTHLTLSDVTVADLDGSNLVTKFVSGSLTAKADLTGSALYLNSGSDRKIVFHSDRTFVNLLGDWNASTTDPTAYVVSSTNPPNTQGNFLTGVGHLEVSGGNPAGVDASSTVNYGLGVLFAVVVAPSRDRIDTVGVLGTETGTNWNFDFRPDDPFPPPPPPAFPEPALIPAFGALLLLRYPRRDRIPSPRRLA